MIYEFEYSLKSNKKTNSRFEFARLWPALTDFFSVQKSVLDVKVQPRDSAFQTSAGELGGFCLV